MVRPQSKSSRRRRKAIVTSMAGFSVLFNNIDDRKNPTTGYAINYKQDVAGLGGQSEFIRETFDARWYHPITEDFIGLIHLQGGQINSFGSKQALIINNFMEVPSWCADLPPEESDRETSRPVQYSGERSWRYHLLWRVGGGGLSDLRLAERSWIERGSVRRRRQFDRIWGADRLLEFLGYTFCPPPNSIGRVFPTTQLSCSSVGDPNQSACRREQV